MLMWSGAFAQEEDEGEGEGEELVQYWEEKEVGKREKSIGDEHYKEKEEEKLSFEKVEIGEEKLFFVWKKTDRLNIVLLFSWATPRSLFRGFYGSHLYGQGMEQRLLLQNNRSLSNGYCRLFEDKNQVCPFFYYMNHANVFLVDSLVLLSQEELEEWTRMTREMTRQMR